MIAYLDDFRLLLILTLMVIPALVLVRPPKSKQPPRGTRKSWRSSETPKCAPPGRILNERAAQR